MFLFSLIGGLIGLLGRPIEFALVHLYTYFVDFGPTRLIGPFGLAVVVVTVGIRGLLFPVFGWQMRTSRKIQADQRILAPKMAELKKKYKGDFNAYSAAVKELHAEHGLSQFSNLAGCLPVFVQLPLIYGLYNGIRSAVSTLPQGHRGFLWITDVSQSGIDACCKSARSPNTTDYTQLFSSGQHLALLILPVLAALLTVVQSKMMLPPRRKNMTDQEKMQQQVGQSTTYILPLFFLLFSLNFSQGIAVYWVTQSLFMITQQYHLLGWGSMPVPLWVPGARRVTPLSYPKEEDSHSKGAAPPRGPKVAKASTAAKPARASALVTGGGDSGGASTSGGDGRQPVGISTGRQSGGGHRPRNRSNKRKRR